MSQRCCSTSTKSDSTCPSPMSLSFPASPIIINTSSSPLLPPSKINSRDRSGEKIVLPSLCKQIKEPESHPDFDIIMASLKQRSPLVALQNRSSLQPLSASTSLTAEQLGTTLQYYSSHNLAIPASKRNLLDGKQKSSSSIQQSSTRRQPPFDISIPRPAVVYAATEYNIMAARYVTNADPRGFLPVYEYQLHGHTLMIDMETSHVHLESICNILGPLRANILRLVELSTELQPFVRKIEGGFLKIQGLWVPFSVAREVARRVGWSIRFDLVPFFSYQFPTQCLSPNDSGFGDLRHLMGARSRSKQGTTFSDRRNSKPAFIQHINHSSDSLVRPKESLSLQSEHLIRVPLRRPSLAAFEGSSISIAQTASSPPSTSTQIFVPHSSRKRAREEAQS